MVPGMSHASWRVPLRSRFKRNLRAEILPASRERFVVS
jgi:hypothetical protein